MLLGFGDYFDIRDYWI